MSTRYTALGDLLESQCRVGCMDAQVQSQITRDQWRCLFQSSCRQVYGADACHARARYNCN